MTSQTNGKGSPSSVSPESAHSGAILRLLDRPVTAADLAAAAENAARPAEVHGAATLGLLLFRIGDEIAALPAALLRRVTPIASARPIPYRSSGVLLGLCNIRGELVLCADVRRLLGIEPVAGGGDGGADGGVSATRPDRRRMVVIGRADDSWAFEVDALIGIERIDPASVRPAPVTVGRASGAFTSGVTEIEGRSVTVLDGERVIAGFRASLG